MGLGSGILIAGFVLALDKPPKTPAHHQHATVFFSSMGSLRWGKDHPATSLRRPSP